VPERPDEGVVMVSVSEMVKDCVTVDAAVKVSLPAWSAVIEQSPAEMRVSVVPKMVQRGVVVEEKVTLKELDAVAERETVPVPSVLGESAPKVMV
jgi:hypothetical protein